LGFPPRRQAGVKLLDETFLVQASTGVPSIACDCETCLSDDPRDKDCGFRSSLNTRKKILVDTSIDFRQQASTNIKHLDAVRSHTAIADQSLALDDIRPLNFRCGAMGVYANEIAWTDSADLHHL
jgi:phosphoribosyl 1,2-cyclic phosphate phosphodiesterase